MEPDEEEVHLLLSFYLYLNDEVREAYHYLRSVSPASGKLHEFELALFLRMGMYSKLGEIGSLISALILGKTIDESLF